MWESTIYYKLIDLRSEVGRVTLASSPHARHTCTSQLWATYLHLILTIYSYFFFLPLSLSCVYCSLVRVCVCMHPQHLLWLPLCLTKLHDHTTKGHCAAVKKLCSRELVVGHKQRLVTLSQHKLMHQLNTGLPKQSWKEHCECTRAQQRRRRKRLDSEGMWGWRKQMGREQDAQL